MIVRNTPRAAAKAVRQAFSLMEILIVVAIIVVLAGIGGYYFLPQLDKAKDDAAKAQAKVVAMAADTYKKNHGEYPTDVSVLAQPDPLNDNKPYLSDDAINDPWGKPYTIDPAGPNHKGAQCDVYTTSPTSNKQIGNWGK
jgi:general secretion pathway protein G